MPETSSSRTWFETVFELNEPRMAECDGWNFRNGSCMLLLESRKRLTPMGILGPIFWNRLGWFIDNHPIVFCSLS